MDNFAGMPTKHRIITERLISMAKDRQNTKRSAEIDQIDCYVDGLKFALALLTTPEEEETIFSKVKELV